MSQTEPNSIHASTPSTKLNLSPTNSPKMIIIVHEHGDVEVGRLDAVAVRQTETGIALGSYWTQDEGHRRFIPFGTLAPFNDGGMTGGDNCEPAFVSFAPIFTEWIHETVAEMLLACAEETTL